MGGIAAFLGTLKVCFTVEGGGDYPPKLTDRFMLITKWWNLLGVCSMPRKMQQDVFSVDFNDTYFVAIRLNNDDLQRFDQWYSENEPDLPEYVQQVVSAGDKLSLSYDLANDAFTASLTIRDRKSPAHGAVITARSETAWDAFVLVIYKRLVVFDPENVEKAGKDRPRRE